MKHFFLFLSFLFLTAQIANSQDGIGVWTQTYSSTARIFCIAVDPTNQNTMYVGSLDNGINKTTNAGVNWTLMNNGLTYNHVFTIAVSKSNPNIVYAATDSLGGWTVSGLYKSTDGGANWTICSAGIYDSKNIQCVVVHPTDPNIVFCGTFNAYWDSSIGFWKTTNGGTTWTACNTGMGNKNILSCAMNPKNPNVIIAGSSLIYASSTGPVSMYRSNDMGTTWSLIVSGIPQASTDNNPIRCLSYSSSDTNVVLAGLFLNAAALTGGMYLTINGGQTWVQKNSGIPQTQAYLARSCIIAPGSSTEFYSGWDYSGLTNIGVYRSTDAGNSWTNFCGSVFLNTYAVRGLAERSTGNPTLYAGNAGSATANSGTGLYEYSWQASGISGNNSIPDKYALSQNYPNPFNPVTVINYSIRNQGLVTIKIYDITGNEVTTLVNEYKQAGYYNVNFDGKNLSSGTYFYKITSNEFTATKKMVLLK